MSKYQEIGASVDPELKARLVAVLNNEGIPVSDFVRSAAILVIESGRVPFDIKKRKPGEHYVFKESAALA